MYQLKSFILKLAFFGYAEAINIGATNYRIILNDLFKIKSSFFYYPIVKSPFYSISASMQIDNLVELNAIIHHKSYEYAYNLFDLKVIKIYKLFDPDDGCTVYDATDMQ